MGLRRRAKAKKRLVPQIGAVADQADADDEAERKQPGDRRARAAEEDHQRRAADRRQGVERGKGCLGVEGEDRKDDHPEAEARKERAGPRRRVAHDQGSDRSRAELPGPCRQQEEVRARRVAPAPFGRSRLASDRATIVPSSRPPAKRQIARSRRKDDVELLLDREAPGVQQRVELGRRREIIVAAPDV